MENKKKESKICPENIRQVRYLTLIIWQVPKESTIHYGFDRLKGCLSQFVEIFSQEDMYILE